MVQVEDAQQRLVQDRVGVPLDPVAPLVQHDVALGRDHRVGQHEVGHAVGLELHHLAEVLLGDALEIGGVVGGGEGVLVAADRRDALAELVARMLRRALEHQMLEEMRDAGLAGRLVGRADLVPDHVGHDRRAVIGDDDDLHAVAERELHGVRRHPRNLGGGGRSGAGGLGEGGNCGHQNSKGKSERQKLFIGQSPPDAII